MHHKAKTEFKYVELARTLYEQGEPPMSIARYLGESVHTVRDWVLMKTRINA